ncbi:hypothetical protein O181_046199 [Austropuccinia psidii MF-1]|uniref:Uncharacterized protein n=1 Tax=Austropuccinia psidii MF-1 TaxID=1389203 RepID=A0A9Q3HL13_9BASI|nr:hypothetical protein [Austropuccinia psidii MF-1]
MSKTSFKGLGEDGEEEESEDIEVFPALVVAPEGTGGPTLAQSNQHVCHQSDPLLLSIIQQMSQIMANLQAALSS